MKKYEVDHARTSQGPQFTSLTEALAYIRHAINSGEPSMTITRIAQ